MVYQSLFILLVIALLSYSSETMALDTNVSASHRRALSTKFPSSRKPSTKFPAVYYPLRVGVDGKGKGEMSTKSPSTKSPSTFSTKSPNTGKGKSKGKGKGKGKGKLKSTKSPKTSKGKSTKGPKSQKKSTFGESSPLQYAANGIEVINVRVSILAVMITSLLFV